MGGDYLSLNEKVDPDRIGIIGICGWGGMAVNTAALDTRIKATAAMCAQRLEDLKAGEYKLGGGVVDSLPEDAPFFVKDYYDYYKTDRGYHKRSLNSNGGWNVIGCESFVNQPILMYSNEIRSAVLLVHGEKAHSCYFSKDAYADMIKDSKYADNQDAVTEISTSENVETESSEENDEPEGDGTMIMKIGDTKVNVEWEDNQAVEALRDMAKDGDITIQMSMYGGFEQVGSIGQSLPRDDKQTTTSSGDIVLYSGNQMVVFYGSNSWSYTRLGHISDKDEAEMADLLSNGDVTITISRE